MTRNVSPKMIARTVAVSFLLLIMLWFSAGVFQSRNNEYVCNLDEHWTVYKNGELIAKDDNIDNVHFGNVRAGDVLDFYVEIPDQLVGGYSVEFLVYLCSVEAYVDDHLIYSYGTDRVGRDVMVGSGNHFIPLPNNVEGKHLHIVTVLNEDNAFTSISSPRCAKTDKAIIAFASSQTINAVIGTFLFALGLILVCVSAVALFYDRIYFRLLLIGNFSFLMGLWTVLTNKVAQIFTTNFIVFTELEYLSLYWAPIPFGCLLVTMQKEKSGWRRVLALVTLICDTCFAVVVTVLHYTNIVRFPNALICYHVVTAISVITISVACYFSVKERTRTESIVGVALVVLTAILFLDIGRFNLQKFVLPNYEILMNSFIPCGTLIFVVLLLVSYLIYMYDMVMDITEKETLMRLAYHDVLTGLYNRTKYEEMMAELDEEQDKFSLISIDLNDLKYVNDTFGHDKGDLMLTTFANILTSVFNDVGTCFRTGGDEYLVIVREEKVSLIKDAIVQMEEMEDKASAKLIFEIHASYGIANRGEIDDGQAFKVFRLADRRMYEMKSKSKGRSYTFGVDSNK